MKPGASLLIAEPRGNVSKKDFGETLAIAKGRGLEIYSGSSSFRARLLPGPGAEAGALQRFALAEITRGAAVLGNGQQQVLDGDVLVLEPLGLVVGPVEELGEPLRQVLLAALDVEIIMLSHHYVLTGEDARGYLNKSLQSTFAFSDRIRRYLDEAGGNQESVVKRIFKEDHQDTGAIQQAERPYLINLSAKVKAVAENK